MENKENTPRDLFPGALEMMILESLRRQPAHGYALVQHTPALPVADFAPKLFIAELTVTQPLCAKCLR